MTMKLNDILIQTLDILETADEACFVLRENMERGDLLSSNAILDDLSAVSETLDNVTSPLLSSLPHAYIRETLGNISVSVMSVRAALEKKDIQRAVTLSRFQLHPFFIQLRASLYYWGMIFPDEGKMDEYYAREFAAQYRSRVFHAGEEKYRLSVVVPAYNHLEVTKQCIEHILKYTDFNALNAELILIDHGSSDGTLDYFKSLDVAKVIHFSENNRPFVFSTMAQVVEGKYFAYVSSDVLVTQNWAEHLLTCMESDPVIVAAAPATPNTSNLQAIGMPHLEPDDFVSWANDYNHDAPEEYEDRARLMPTIAIYRTSVVQDIGFIDPLFYSMEFWDDDFSLRARRAGFRQVLCPNIACYHFGSVTGGEAKKTENTLELGRALFLQKHGVDAWNQGVCYDYDISTHFDSLSFSRKEVSVLALDCGFGDMVLRIKNVLKKKDYIAAVYSVTEQRGYLEDLSPLSEGAAYCPSLPDDLTEQFPDIDFSFTYLGRDISCYENIDLLLKRIAARLRPDGCFLFACENPFYAPRLHAQLGFSHPDNALRYTSVVPFEVHRICTKYFQNIKTDIQFDPPPDLDPFVALHYPDHTLPDRFRHELSVKRYTFLCYGRQQV